MTCEDAGLLDAVVQPLLGKRVRLQAGAQGVLLAADDGAEASAGSGKGDGASAAAARPASAGGAVTKVGPCPKCMLRLQNLYTELTQ